MLGNIMDYSATCRSFLPSLTAHLYHFLLISFPSLTAHITILNSHHLKRQPLISLPVYKRPAKAIKAAAPRAGTPVAAAPALEVEEAMLADEELNLLAEEARLLDAEEPVAVALRWC